MQFHPRFRYEGEEEDSVENYTSRSPYPTVHLIRASIITAAREVPTHRSLLFRVHHFVRSFVQLRRVADRGHAHATQHARPHTCAASQKYGEDYLLRLPEANSKRLQALGLEQVRKLCPSAMSSADQDSTLASNKKEAQHKKTKKTTPRA
jgi:hypothetical protein